MFYRRKYYVVATDFLAEFNRLFNDINLPNQRKHGARLVGRWMVPLSHERVEVFAIWEYDSKADYERIEAGIRGDTEHVQRIQHWFQRHGGRERVHREGLLDTRNEEIFSTVTEPL